MPKQHPSSDPDDTTAADQPDPTAVLDAEADATPYVHTLPDGSTIKVAHETTLSAIGKDEANEAFYARGSRGMEVTLLRLALPPAQFERLRGLTDSQIDALFTGWLKHCGLMPGESKASTS